MMRQQGYSEEEIDRSIDLDKSLGLNPPKSLYDPVGQAEKHLKYVPATSNLAKVYYLESMGGFIENNKDYYHSVLRKRQEEEQQKQEQKNWDKYL